MDAVPAHHEHILAATRHWLTRAIIGLNLCPFAKGVHVKNQIRYAITEATHDADLMDMLDAELQRLAATDPEQLDTTLLIVPCALQDFMAYNDFVQRAERSLKRLRLQGILQIASFHPHYVFAGSEPDAIENHTNRAPYPILHLLREDSIARAVEAFPDAAEIYERNEETMRRLGPEGLQAWMDEARPHKMPPR